MRPEQLDFELVVACPEGTTRPRAADGVRKRMRVSTEIPLPQRGAHLLVTDVWASMGQESEQAAREAFLAPYQLNRSLLDRASSTPCICIACQPIGARKSRQSSWTHPIRSSGRKRKIVCMRKKR